MEYSQRILPNTFEHLIQWLAIITTGDWVRIQEYAKQLLSATLSRKIRKSSFDKIIKSKPRTISRLIYREHARNQTDNEFIISGRVYDAMLYIIENIDPILDIPLERDIPPVHVSKDTQTVLILLAEMYERKFCENIRGFEIISDLSTSYSAFWCDGEICVLTVGAPCKRIRDISKLTGIEENPLAEKLSKFTREYADIPIIVATHSYGFECLMKCVEKPTIEKMIIFNPHSFQEYKHMPLNVKVYDNGLDDSSPINNNYRNVNFFFAYDSPQALVHFLTKDDLTIPLEV